MADAAGRPGVTLRPDVAAFLELVAAQPGPSMSEMGHVQARAMMSAMGGAFEEPIGELAVMRDLVLHTGEGSDIRLRLFDNRTQRDATPLVVFFHGGGFVLGDLDSHGPACAEIARTLDMPVVSVEYGLAPERPWPAAPKDCEAAARWLAGSPAELGFTVTGIITAGDSAGGGLTITTAMALRDHPAAVPVIAQMPFYPVTDLLNPHPSHSGFGSGFLLEKRELDWFWNCYAADRAHWSASPLLFDQIGMPPTVVATAGLDPLRDEGRAYAAALITAGVPTSFYEAEGMIHGFLSLRKALPSGTGDLHHCLSLLRALITKTSTLAQSKTPEMHAAIPQNA